MQKLVAEWSIGSDQQNLAAQQVQSVERFPGGQHWSGAPDLRTHLGAVLQG